jgi:hypothetical protein
MPLLLRIRCARVQCHYESYIAGLAATGLVTSDWVLPQCVGFASSVRPPGVDAAMEVWADRAKWGRDPLARRSPASSRPARMPVSGDRGADHIRHHCDIVRRNHPGHHLARMRCECGHRRDRPARMRANATAWSRCTSHRSVTAASATRARSHSPASSAVTTCRSRRASMQCLGIAKLIVMEVCAGDGRAIVRHHFACWTQVSCRQIRKALVRTPRLDKWLRS